MLHHVWSQTSMVVLQMRVRKDILVFFSRFFVRVHYNIYTIQYSLNAQTYTGMIMLLKAQISIFKSVNLFDWRPTLFKLCIAPVNVAVGGQGEMICM